MKITATFLNLFIILFVGATNTAFAAGSICDSALNGNVAEVKRFLANGMDPDSKCDENTSLMSAATRGHSAIIKILLTAGADANLSGYKGSTALMRGTGGGDLETIKILLNSGADLHLIDDAGATALMWASGKNIEFLQEGILFLQEFDIFHAMQKAKSRLESTQTILPDMTKMLLDAGADPHVSDKSGWTALMYAAKVGSANVTRLLIKKGVDVNLANGDGWTALDIAESIGDRGVARILRKAGAE